MRYSGILALVLGGALSALPAVGCSGPSGETVDRVGLRADTPLPARAGSVIADGCELDPWQRSTLGLPGARRVLQEVILLCLVPRADGSVGPRDPSATAALGAQIAELRQLGYRVSLGVSFTDETGTRYDGKQTRDFLADPAWRTRFRETLVTAMAPADGIELDLQQLPDDARPFVTALVTEISPVIRPAKKLGIFAPPSVATPSDLPGGEAFARATLAPLVDRWRVMTLDFSDRGPGPTLDPGWAVDAARVALGDTAAVDIAVPLYGTDFGPRGHRSVSWLEATGLASSSRVDVQRGPTTAPFFGYVTLGEPHELWFDDAESTANALGAWRLDVLPPNVGVVFYGLGAEEPSLFERLAARSP
jgi:spore germination protein YaaH